VTAAPANFSPAPAPSGVVEVAAGLVFRRQKLLITQRYPEAHLGGLWEFPGGKRKPEETFPECLRRELLEELGIEIEVNELVEEISHAYPEKTVRLMFFRCRWVRHEPQRLGCPDFRWITAGELSQFAFPEADAGLVRRLIEIPAFWT
jgi:mutator protein MutT